MRFESEQNPGPDEKHGGSSVRPSCRNRAVGLPRRTPARGGAGEEQRSTRPGRDTSRHAGPYPARPDRRPPTDRPTDRRTKGQATDDDSDSCTSGHPSRAPSRRSAFDASPGPWSSWAGIAPRHGQTQRNGRASLNPEIASPTLISQTWWRRIQPFFDCRVAVAVPDAITPSPVDLFFFLPVTRA